MKILHLLPYEKKFVPVTAEIFDACQEIENAYRVMTLNVSEARDQFSNQKNVRVVNKLIYPYSNELKKDLAWCDCVVVHFMDEMKAKVVLRVPDHLPVVWRGWGADFYDIVSNGGGSLLGDETALLVQALDKKMVWSIRELMQTGKNIAQALIKYAHAKTINRAIIRVDYFSAAFPEEFDLLRSHFGGRFHPIYTQLSYGGVERRYTLGVESVYGNNILVGNSATATNNHLEVFNMLSQLDLGCREILVPLSYGDADYRDAVIARGRALFGERLKPIVEFVPLEQYNTLIAQCSVVVMGHKRQQGGGNVHTQLYKGAKVFLDEASAMLQSLKNQGAIVYTLRDLQAGGANVFSPLTDEQRRKNREVLDVYGGEESVERSIRDFVCQIRSHGVKKNA